MPKKTYRFLLRMPDELRERLADAAARNGRSLNTELVSRLEESLEGGRSGPHGRRLHSLVPRLRGGASSQGERSMQTHARRRVLAVGVLVAAAVTVAVALAVVLGPSSPQAAKPAADEMPLTFQLRQTLLAPGSEQGEGPGSAADAEFIERAYPSDTISVAQMDSARASFSSQSKRPFKGARGQPGVWMSVGPAKALNPLSPLRDLTLNPTHVNYLPAAYVAGGRTTSLALNEAKCTENDCVLYITPAGGGVWRTDRALRGDANWKYLGGPLGINAAGAVTVDPNDPSGKTIYVGTGEANVCASGCVAGTGLYKSTNGGETWSAPIGKPEFQGKGIGEIVVEPGDPNTLYVATTTALRGATSVCCSGVTRPVPGITRWGLYKSTNAGATWSFIHNGAALGSLCTGDATEYANAGVCSPRGVRDIALDPSNPDVIYAASYARGTWRSNDAGATWTQIKPSLNPTLIQSRPSIAVAKLANGKTRLWVHEGNNGTDHTQFSRTDDAATGVPAFTLLSSGDPADPGYAFFDQCSAPLPTGGQCWYDIWVYSPPGFPDVVYTGGSYKYNEAGGISNGRAVVMSTDGGVSGTDMTADATDELHPNAVHPDQHFLVTVPGDPYQFIESGDGGVVRASGRFTDVSVWCDHRGLTGAALTRCKQLLSRVPKRIESMNNGLRTLQFQSLAVSPHDVNKLMGGTQDNGTWENRGPVLWENIMIGDGGQSGFDVGIPEFRFQNLFNANPSVNFDSGDMSKWIYIGAGLAGGLPEFYIPMISDPAVSKTLFAGGGLTAYRTKTAGLGTRTYADAVVTCNFWTGTVACGDWARLGPTTLTNVALGDRAGGAMAAIERTKADTSTAWAATTTGRVFVSKNVDAEPVAIVAGQRVATSVSWTRIDDDAITPGRFVSGIHVDPANGNHAWVSYSGFDANTPATPGHVFEVTFNPATNSATWVDRSYDWGDLPATDIVADSNGDLYASSDFGVSRLVSGTTSWTLAGTDMPNVEVAGLTIVPEARRLYAASHGLGAWQLKLP